MTKFYTNVCLRGDKFLVREIVDGQRLKHVHCGFSPDIFVPSNNPDQKDAVGIDDVPLMRMNCENIYDAKDIISSYNGIDSFDVYGSSNWISQYISKTYDEKITFDHKLIRVFNVDIEIYCPSAGFPHADQAKHPVNLIQMMDSFDNDLVRVWGNKKPNDIPDNTEFVFCQDEESLLRKFVEYWEMNCPDVMTGWNIKGFDVPYLCNRINKVLGENQANRLSPWKDIKQTTYRSNFGKDAETFLISGVSILDYLDLYQKYTYSVQESYKLDNIAYVELDEKKIDYSDQKDLNSLCDTDYDRFLLYGVQDVRLVDRLEKKMKLIELVYTMSYMTKQNYVDTFSPVRSWEAIIYNKLRSINQYSVIKTLYSGEQRKIEGGYVKVPILGLKKWIVSVDLASLYPHLIMQYNIGFETKAGNASHLGLDVDLLSLINKDIDLSVLKKHDLSMTALGICYTKDKKSILSVLMNDLYNQRKTVKEEMLEKQQLNENSTNRHKYDSEIASLNNLQRAIKTFLVSAYGALANKYFEYYDPDIAESITVSGQLSIRWIERCLNEYMNNLLNTVDCDYVVASDTDSIYLDMSRLVDVIFKDKTPNETEIVNFLDNVMKEKVEPYISKKYDELAEYTNAYENKMFMDREGISSVGFWTSKKHYALLVHDNEGVRYAEPKMKVMGLEIVKSSTPLKVRSDLKSSVKLMLTTDEKTVIDHIADVKKKYMSMTPEEMASPRGTNNLEKYMDVVNIFGKGTPKHVKAALVYNWLVKKHDLDLELIQSGEKIKFIDMKVPNPSGQAVIGWPSHLGLPEEFGLHDYINKNLSYDKTFLKPIESMLSAIGWKSEEVITLEDFF